MGIAAASSFMREPVVSSIDSAFGIEYGTYESCPETRGVLTLSVTCAGHFAALMLSAGSIKLINPIFSTQGFRVKKMSINWLRQLAILLAPLLLTACATTAQRQGNYMLQVQADTISQARACIDEVSQRAEFAHLKTKLFLDSSGASTPLEYLSGNTRPTKSDISDVYNLHAAIQPCRKIYLEGAGKIHPAVVTIFVNSYADSNKLWVEFASGRMTWGEFNQRRADISRQVNQQINEARTMIASQLQNQHQFEMAQRQRAIESLQQWAYQQQVLENQRLAIMAEGHAAAIASRPITCNFNQMGPNSMTCN
jgi:hypothetical protein